MALFVGCQKEDPSDPNDIYGDLEENPAVKSAVEALAAEAPSKAPTLSGMEVWQDGYAASGAWFGGTNRRTKHQMWSVTKSFTSLAVGMAIEDGKLSLSDLVAPLFPDEVAAAEKSLSAMEFNNLKKLTVKDLLTMTNGHVKDPTSEYAMKNALVLVANMNKYFSGTTVNATAMFATVGMTLPEMFFSYPFEAVPGETFCYDSFGSCILAEIFKIKTGVDVSDYLYERLFKPLGIDRPVWDTAGDVSAGGWGLHLSTDDMMLFGRLLLAGGTWDGKQLLPESYLSDATSMQVQTTKHPSKGYTTTGYGFQFWTIQDGFMCSGMFGQRIIVLPSKKAVIVFASTFDMNAANLLALVNDTSSVSGSEALSLVWEHIIPAL